MRSVKLTFLLFIITINAFAQNADIRLLRQINLHRNTDFDNVNILISNTTTPISIALPLVLIGHSWMKKDKIAMRKSLVIATTISLAAIVITSLKYTINRERPFVTYPDIQQAMHSGGSPSFPSGHTSDAFSTATSLSLQYPKWYLIAPAYTWAVAVGYSRMDLGMHYPSDVLAGAIVGAGSAWVCYKVNEVLLREKSKKGR